MFLLSDVCVILLDWKHSNCVFKAVVGGVIYICMLIISKLLYGEDLVPVK